MTLGIFGFGPVVQLPPLPPRAPTRPTQEPPRVVEMRTCVVCGKAFRPRWKAARHRRPSACSAPCREARRAAAAVAAMRAALTAALTADGMTTREVAAKAGVSNAIAAYHLRGMVRDGLVTESGVRRLDALGRPRFWAGWTLVRTEAAE